MPDNWAWCRLPEIAVSIFAGGDKPTICEKTKTNECTIPIFSNGIENNGLYGYTNKANVEIPSVTISARGTIGFTCVREEPFMPIVRLITITPNYGINLYYLKAVIDSLLVVGEGSSIPQLTVPTIKEFILPLPPENEQKNIVEAITAIFENIDSLNKEKYDLQTTIKNTKSKILDLAIHGKLVPQDPNDETAEELLKRIATSDNRPYKKFDEEVLFEIPESWTWCFLHTISALLNGDRGENYPSKKDYVESGIPFINAGCLDNGNIKYDVANYITEEKYNSLRAGKIQKGDILYCLRGSLGKTGFVITDNKGAISSSLCIFRLTEAIIPQYFLYVLNSNAIKVQQKMVDNGTAQPNLSAKDVSNYAIPIPPLAEQHRIVAKIEELFKNLDEILQNLLA